MGDKLKVSIRGRDTKDNRFFSNEAIEKLRYAQEEVVWLLNRGYPIGSIINLVGGRYQFSSRQRAALQRASCTYKQLEIRKEKEININNLNGKCINIDGFNLIIVLEVALSRGVVIRSMDGAMRDLAGLRGTYKLIDKTEVAINILGMAIDRLGVRKVNFFLDSPISNSGRLKVKILELSSSWNAKVNISIVSNPDVLLESMNNVITSDSVILDKCESWINLSKYIIDSYIYDSWIVNLGSVETVREKI